MRPGRGGGREGGLLKDAGGPQKNQWPSNVPPPIAHPSSPSPAQAPPSQPACLGRCGRAGPRPGRPTSTQTRRARRGRARRCGACVCVCVCEWVGWKVGSKSWRGGRRGGGWKNCGGGCEGGEGRRCGFYSVSDAARASHLAPGTRACRPPTPTPRHCAAWHPPSPPSSPDLQKCCRRQRPRPPPRPPPRNRPSPAALPPNPAPFHRLHASALAVPSPSFPKMRKKKSSHSRIHSQPPWVTLLAKPPAGGGGVCILPFLQKEGTPRVSRVLAGGCHIKC